jgi:hypothetical protein
MAPMTRVPSELPTPENIPNPSYFIYIF